MFGAQKVGLFSVRSTKGNVVLCPVLYCVDYSLTVMNVSTRL